MKFTDEDESNRIKEIEYVKKKLKSYFVDDETKDMIKTMNVNNIKSIMENVVKKVNGDVNVTDKTYTQIADIIASNPMKDTNIYSTDFKNGIGKSFDLDELKKRFQNQLKDYEKVDTNEVYKKRVEKLKNEKKLHMLIVNFTISESNENVIRVPIENILKDGGSNSLFNYATMIDNILNKISNNKETIITDIDSKINGELTERSKTGDKELKSQISFLLKKLKNIIEVKYGYTSPDKVLYGASKDDKRFQKFELTRILESIKKLEDTLDKPELGADTTPKTKKEEESSTTPTEEKKVHTQKEKKKVKDETDKYSETTSSQKRYNTDNDDDDGDDDDDDDDSSLIN